MKPKRISLYILITLAAAALIWLVFTLAPGSSVDTPPVVLPSQAILPSPTVSGETGPGSEGNDPDTPISIGPGTVQAAIGALSKADNYSRILNISSFWSGGSGSSQVNVWVQGDNLRCMISSRGAAKNILIKNGELWIWYSDSKELYHGSAGDHDADEYQMLVSYEELLDLPKSSIISADYELYQGESCIYASYVSGELGYEKRLWISVGTGLLMGCEVYDGSELIYSMVSSEPDISTPDESVFALPD